MTTPAYQAGYLMGKRDGTNNSPRDLSNEKPDFHRGYCDAFERAGGWVLRF